VAEHRASPAANNNGYCREQAGRTMGESERSCAFPIRGYPDGAFDGDEYDNDDEDDDYECRRLLFNPWEP